MNINISGKVLATIKLEIFNFFASCNIKLLAVNLERSDNFKHGDISTSIALEYAKTFKKDPYLLAQDIADYLSRKQLQYIEKIEVIKPGFINIFFNQVFYRNILIEILELKDSFGKNNSLKNQKWVVEHTSPNPNKAMHLGHLRNNLIGMSLVRILSWNGAIVVSDAVDNNRGIAIAKLMWGFLAHMRKIKSVPIEIEYWNLHPNQWFSPKEQRLASDVFITKCYVLGELDFKNDLVVEQIVRNLVIRWEMDEKGVRKLWSHVLNYAYEGIERTLSRLGSHWDKVWHEHEHYQKGKSFIRKGLKEGIFRKLEDGAVLTNLSHYNLPDTILLKKDGTSLYITQDIALVALKKDFYNARKLIWVVGSEQSLAMKQLFAVCEQLGIGSLKGFTHISYGYVGLKGDNGDFKRMSSREGKVVLIDDVIDIVRDKILQRFINKGRKDDDLLHSLSEKMALAAVKFSILKSDRTQNFIFDTNQSIEMTGDSGIYVLYSYVRTQSVINKGRNKRLRNTDFFTKSGQEGYLVKLLMFFPEVVQRAKDDLSVHHIAQYLIEICSAFNTWYSKETILDGSKQQDYKLAITQSVGIVIKNGLEILGIKVPERM
ncbi:MAG: arginine--tRNA ligase [Nanoarchaeota archaeon]|nr:arginine--tRNA ligase [Patescibacteria group bacterium]MCG2719487.1 arginine--tRNA ligase [Nanoarchaeota archaeon]